jgi:predicted dehydrogenase
MRRSRSSSCSPALPEREALSAMASEFAECIRQGIPSRTDGLAGMRVLSVLEAAGRSLADGGAPSLVEGNSMELETQS